MILLCGSAAGAVQNGFCIEIAVIVGCGTAQVGTGDRSERIRTYNFPQSRVTDHRYGISAFDLPRLMEGDLGQILEPIRESLNQEAVQNLLSGLTSGQ